MRRRRTGSAGERVDAVDHAGRARGLGDVDDVDGGVGRRPGRAQDVERAAADIVGGLASRCRWIELSAAALGGGAEGVVERRHEVNDILARRWRVVAAEKVLKAS